MFLKPHADTDSLDVELEDTTIQHQKLIKILGITIGEDMGFDEHIWKGKTSITKSLHYKSSLIRTLKPFLPFHLLSQVGNAIINSTIQYCAPIWGPSSAGNRAKVQKAQIRAARIVTGKWSREGRICHRQELLSKMNWPNIDQMVTIATMNLMKEAMTGHSSEGLNSLFKVVEPKVEARRQTLRVDHKGPKTRPISVFSANAAQIFNQLPVELRSPSLTIKQFKKKNKKHTMNNYHLAHH